MKADDRILPITRVVAALIVPFLWLAFLILFFFPESTGEHFAWLIRPHMTAMYMGAGYLGGSWLFLHAIFGKRWHRIRSGFLPITLFTWFMMLATFRHWDRFAHGRLGFTLWLILYLITPFLVPALWFYNSKTDSDAPEENDLVIPPRMGGILKGVALVSLLFATAGFLIPDFVIRFWPWSLTPLTARVMCGWVALLGMGAFMLSNETRWSGWKVPLQSIAIWHILIFVAAALNHANFKRGLINWYTLSIGVMLAGIFSFYLMMELRKRKLEAAAPSQTST